MKPWLLVLAAAACAAQVRVEERGVPATAGTVEAPFGFTALGAAWKGDAQLSVRVRARGGEWKWLRRSADFEGNASDLLYFPPGTTVVEYEVSSGEVRDLRFVFIDPGQSEPAQVKSRDASQPAMVTRAQWGARPPVSTPVPTKVTHLIVHHTADAPPASGDFAAWVRAIQAYHVQTNGWNDIGYNFLIAGDGTLFEGRGDGILGAHFSGYNTGTMGAAVLGSYMEAAPPSAALESLKALLGWQAERWGIDPAARRFHNSSQRELYTISGHRDSDAPPRTECPGDAFYPLLPEIRRQLAGGALLSQDAENGFGSWTGTGLWRVSQNRAAAGTSAFYYGDAGTRTYETGREANSGVLESPVFWLSSNAVLTFRSWYETENTSTLWDEKYVEISVNGAGWRVVARISGGIREWSTVKAALQERGPVRLRFRFDTVDGVANRYEGWYVDDIAVEPER